MNKITKIDNDILDLAKEMMSKTEDVLLSIMEGLDLAKEEEVADEDDLESIRYRMDKHSEKVEEYNRLSDELLKRCLGDEGVAGFYKEIAKNLLEENYESAYHNTDSLLWYFNDKYNKLNNLND